MQLDFDYHADIFKALAHPVRVRIVAGLIQKHECHVGKMADGLGLPQPQVSQHLTILKVAGIIEGFRNGTQICYKVINDDVRKIFAALA
ncbi:MAG: metalloregulator ArsR/SmtB family transcription factor [Negativicutes bacterium]|jgi:ArsR family transcriptional regulator